ncbi:TlpA family protein disulfide reductase [Hymenobacter lapidiphilus]|uniref:TlpA family protein disulfide reductase n=2 Tax=Hymenobacter lapidiphilus TaxID=2608003 RepID=A0A7Y7PT69_9BACT|nr:TlpA disulfide reductase family protein [Hymenobacter lapidiphilus]NVO33515.1 TlpA family protein disulfide reductase [Hymenobacter lapidiphilus]
MSKILYSACLLQVLAHATYAQTGADMLRKYQAAIGSFRTADYVVQRIDTFGNGQVWNNTGRVVLQRNPTSKLLGAAFLASRPDLAQSYFYDGTTGFELDDKAKTFILVKEPYEPSVLGSPAGQMLVEELLAIDPTYETVTYRRGRAGQGGVLRLKYPDQPALDVLERYTDVTIDEASGLPRSVRTSVVRGGGHWVTRKVLSKLRLNDASSAAALHNPAFLTAYASSVPVPRPVVNTSLVGKPAPAFRLISLAKKPVQLRDFRGKVVVLDFWETSCAPCVKAMPQLQQLQEQYGNKVVVIGVLLDPGASERAQGILRRQQAHYLNVVGTKAEESAYHVRAFPRYVVIGKDGKVLLDKEGGLHIEAVKSAVKLAVSK